MSLLLRRRFRRWQESQQTTPGAPVYVDFGPPPRRGRIRAGMRWSARLVGTVRVPVSRGSIRSQAGAWSASGSGRSTVPRFRGSIAGGLRQRATGHGAVDLSVPLAQLRAEDDRLALLLLYAANHRSA